MALITIENVARFENAKHEARNACATIRQWHEENPIGQGELVRRTSGELRHALDLFDQVEIEPTDEDQNLDALAE
jgi:hypothetical protein